MTSVPANDATAVFLPVKNGRVYDLVPANDARKTWFFCLGMASLPADDAREASFLLHQKAASELGALVGVPMAHGR